MAEQRKSEIEKTQRQGLHLILKYALAVLSVFAAVVILSEMNTNGLDDAPHVSIFLCAVIVSAWFSGVRPGALALILSALAFDYYFLSPVNSFAIEPGQLPRVLFFMVPAVFIVWVIAAQKRATEEILRGRMILDETMDTIPALVWSAQPDGSLDFINRRHREFTGLSLEDVRGWRWVSVIHPDDRERLVQEWKTALATNEPLKTETRLRRAQGDYRWLLIYAVPLLDESGKIIKWYGTKTDITELKQAEDALRKNEDRIQLIIDTIPIMAWCIRPDGIVDFLNQRWVDYTRLSREQYIKDPTGPVHPDDVPRVMEKWRVNRTAGKAFDDEIRLRGADGEYRWFLVRTAPLHDEDGNVVNWYGVSIDIEESKRAEVALRESEQRYLSLFANMAEGVAYFKMLFRDGKLQDAIYLEVNPAWENLTGLKNVIGRKITEVLPGILDTNTEFIERCVRVALTGQPERFESYSNHLKRWLSTSAYCPKKEHVIVVFDDITERKLGEETLLQSYEEIKQLTQHLQKVREEERIHIAREIHDELGQQITAINMDVAWIDKKTPEEATDIKRKLKNIIALLDGSNQSVRRILSELRPRILDDHGWVEAIEWLARQFSETTGIPVKFTAPEKDIIIPEQVATCLFRICQEAFTNITRYARAKNVSCSLSIIEENIVLAIEDDGIGFDAAFIQNKKSFGILGMKERVLSLAGKFELFSSPGRGTRITASLPIQCK